MGWGGVRGVGGGRIKNFGMKFILLRSPPFYYNVV